MKNLFLIAALTAAISFSSFAQSSKGYGIKAGLNYNANGNYFESIDSNAKNPEGNVGFHIGVFGKIGSSVYFRPELVYTSTKSAYDSKDFTMQKLDAPLLIGAKLIGPISIFGGPAFQYILNSKFDGNSVDKIDNDLSVGLNFGFALNFDSVGIDLRYERGFSENEAVFLNNNGVNISKLDTRPSQLILSVSLALN